MDVMSNILIVMTALVSAAITYILTKKKSVDDVDRSTDNNAIEELQKQVDSLNKQKEKVETLLEEARSKSEDLSHQLKTLSSEGKAAPEVLARLADTEKLKKKIKQLEDEIEENEEDLEDAEKKIKKKNAEYSELQEEKRAIEKEFKAAKDELNTLSEKLKQVTDELSLKMESLTFVQAILSAPEFSDSITTNLFKKVDALSNFVEGDMYDTLKAVGDYKPTDDSLFEADLRRWEAVQKKSWIAGKTAIAFVGEFSAGKTSIVNRILSQDDPNVPRLPVSTKATTAIPTYISGGVKTDYRFFTQDNKLKKIEADLFNRVTKEVLDQVGGVSNLIQYFVMSYKNENLNNLSILDTPGFNSNDKEDGERTLEVINECDALFWVFDVNAGTVNKSSINLIKKNLRKPLYVVINKVDTKANSEVDSVEKLIKETFQREGVTVEDYIRFSGKAPLKSIMDPILNVTSTTQETEYPQRLLQRLEATQTVLLSKTKKEKSEFDKCVKKANRLVEKYNNAITSTHEDCEIAVGIPHWEEHWFSSNRYEMDVEEYNNLAETLNRICTERMDSLCTLYNEQMDTQQEGQDAWRNYQESLSDCQKLDECIASLNKYIKKLNNAY
jgi:GTPase SAR1 family protein/prefoldin subunit 5